jgi:hypothetical protein
VSSNASAGPAGVTGAGACPDGDAAGGAAGPHPVVAVDTSKHSQPARGFTMPPVYASTG